jgi:DNA-binding NarL/FixJ family response regulator
MQQVTTEALERAREAMRRGAWLEAAAVFRDVIATEPSCAEAHEGLGTAAWWVDDQATVLEARENAFRLYREQGDARSAGRLATHIALDHADYHGDVAVASGWLSRAERLLQGIEPPSEYALMKLYQSYISLMFHNDAPAARVLHAEGSLLASQHASFDVQMLALALDGLICVREGRVADGMRCMDEAMASAVGGEMSDLVAIGNTCCALIYACEAVADYDRATQWCRQTLEFMQRTGISSLFSVCRNYYATVLIWKGAWDEAEAELTAAIQELSSARQHYTREGLAKLGELRRRQGRLEEAEALLARAEPHQMALLSRGALALDRDDAASAIDFAQRFLRRISEEDQAERVFGLELLLRAHLRNGDLASAGEDLQALEKTSASVGTRALRATATAGRGLFARARGDLEDARRALEDAADLFAASDDAFDAARVRLDLSAVLRDLGRDAGALEQAVMAQDALRRLGAMHHAELAGRVIQSMSGGLGAPPVQTSLPHGLTAREAEVLWLLAAGKTNQDIAEALVLSVRTVERHISTIYQKLQLHGQAARAAAAAFALNLKTP